jgi:hypothetical protein
MPYAESSGEAGLLGGLVGADIVDVWFEQSQTGADDTSPILMSLWIVLHDRAGIRISAARGGAGVRVSSKAPVYADMGEWGEIAVVRAPSRYGLRPGRVVDAWFIDSPQVAPEFRLAGVRWRLADKTDVAVFQDDDCLLVGPFEELVKDAGVARYELRLVPVVDAG